MFILLYQYLRNKTRSVLHSYIILLLYHQVHKAYLDLGNIDETTAEAIREDLDNASDDLNWFDGMFYKINTNYDRRL